MDYHRGRDGFAAPGIVDLKRRHYLEAESEFGPVERTIIAEMGGLLRDLESASRRLQRWIPKLHGLDEPGSSTTLHSVTLERPEEEQVDVPSKDVRIEVPEASVDDLLDFQEQLSQIPGVSITLIQGLRKGGVSFLVRLDSENEDPYEDGSSLESQPRVVCMFCGKVISDGTAGVSHGLCPDCARAFLKGETPR